jgi:hypothetical protein
MCRGGNVENVVLAFAECNPISLESSHNVSLMETGYIHTHLARHVHCLPVALTYERKCGFESYF